MKLISKSRISTKLIIVSIAICLIFSVLLGWIYLQYKGTMYQGKHEKTKQVVETAWGVINYYSKESQAGNLSEEEAKTKAREAIDLLRYNEDEYFWISDIEGNIIKHPISPDLEGTNLINEEDSKGKLFIKEMINICKESDEGFVDYYWPKPGFEEPVPKISYAKLHNDWGWILISGIYVDDVEAQLKKVSALFIGAILFVFIFVLGAFTLLIRKIISKPISKLVQISEKLAIGDVNIDINNNTEDNTKDEVQILASSMSKMTANIKEQASAAEKIALGEFNVNIETKCDGDILSKSLNTVIKTLKNLVYNTELIEDAAITGDLQKRGDTEEFNGGYKDVIKGINNIIDTFVGHIDSVPLPIMITDNDLNIKFMNKTGAKVAEKPKEQILGTKCYKVFNTGDCQSENCACIKAINQGNAVTSETQAHPNGNIMDILYTATPVRDKENNIVGGLEVIVDQTVIKKNQRINEKQAAYSNKEVEILTENLKKMAEGNLQLDLQPTAWDEDTKLVGTAFNEIKENLSISVDSIKTYINEISSVLNSLANSNFNVQIANEYNGDFKIIKESLNHIIDSFNKMISEINSSADQVAAGVKQLSDGNQELSQGTNEQASSIEELTASISQIATQTQQNASNAQTANDLTNESMNDATNGKLHMDKMLLSMEKIDEASNNISKIIKVIDEIAFQTNILALNAAVEAARAGVHGKGFAVVAEEVRNLAAKSANAAKETTSLIEGTVNTIKEGTENANDTSEALNKIVNAISQASELIKQIAVASKEQEIGINQVNEGIDQVSSVVQKNSANAEESAAASEELSGQAEMLKNLVDKFELKENFNYLISSQTLDEGNTKQEYNDFTEFGKY